MLEADSVRCLRRRRPCYRRLGLRWPATGTRGFGGTSASSPIIAATYALAGRPAPGTNPASYLYANPSGLFDVVGGNNDVTVKTCVIPYLCNAVAGYDGPTGLGSPNGISAFAQHSGEPTVPAKTGNLVGAGGNGLVDLSWSAPYDGGSAISGYTITETQPSQGAVACAVTAATHCRVSGLTNGTGYSFTVHANNAIGPGPESDASAVVVPGAVPGAPTGVVAARGDGSATVSWTAAAANGLPIDLYTAVAAPGSRSCTASGNSTQCTVTGLTNGQPYTFSVVAHNAAGTGPASSASVPVTPGVQTSTYHPMSPVRALDTRSGAGLSGRLAANSPRTFAVAGRLGIPAEATAVTGNVTVVGSTAGWAVYLGPDPVANPTTSTINFGAGQVGGNGLTVALSASGSLSATYVSSGSNTTDLVFDVTGYFTPNTTGDTYHPIDPARELDTRTGVGLTGKLSANTPRSFVVAGRNSVPASARAVTGNVTVVGSSAGWAVYLGPVSDAHPSTSAVNFAGGTVAGNNLTVALDEGGNLWTTFIGPAGATTDLVFDVTGYYTADATGASFVPRQPGSPPRYTQRHGPGRQVPGQRSADPRREGLRRGPDGRRGDHGQPHGCQRNRRLGRLPWPQPGRRAIDEHDQLQSRRSEGQRAHGVAGVERDPLGHLHQLRCQYDGSCPRRHGLLRSLR